MHLRAERVQLQHGAPVRFCQKCSRFQALSEVRPSRMLPHRPLVATCGFRASKAPENIACCRLPYER